MFMFSSTIYKLGAKLTFYHFILAFFFFTWIYNCVSVIDSLASYINCDKTHPPTQRMIGVWFCVAAYQL